MATTAYDCKINGLQVMEVTIKAFSRQPIMEATYATTETREVDAITQLSTKAQATITHGRCTANPVDPRNPWRWSEETMKILDDLLLSMEHDLLPRHFKVSAGLEEANERSASGRSEEPDQV